MKIGDLVKYRGDYYADWLGVITQENTGFPLDKTVHWINLREHLFEYCSLEVISESR